MHAVVVTGASTGIGRAIALELARFRYAVIATVRRAEDAEALQKASKTPISCTILDVTDHGSVERAAGEILEVLGDRGLFGLVNNAGIVIPGPLEHLPIEAFERQLAVNLTGVLRVTQTFLPQLRRARGRIVNISSTSGLVAFPMLGAYNASKFGLEGMSDALRMELAGAVDVSLVEPGPVQSEIWERSQRSAQEIWDALPPIAHEQYGTLRAGLVRQMEQATTGAVPARKVADAVRRALEARRPKTRYRVNAGAAHARWLPDRWRDALARRILKKA